MRQIFIYISIAGIFFIIGFFVQAILAVGKRADRRMREYGDTAHLDEADSKIYPPPGYRGDGNDNDS